MVKHAPPPQAAEAEVDVGALLTRLEEAESTLAAIRDGHVEAVDAPDRHDIAALGQEHIVRGKAPRLHQRVQDAGVSKDGMTRTRAPHTNRPNSGDRFPASYRARSRHRNGQSDST